jgi:hypothetical protein
MRQPLRLAMLRTPDQVGGRLYPASGGGRPPGPREARPEDKLRRREEVG